MSDLNFNCPHCEQSLEAPEDMPTLSSTWVVDNDESNGYSVMGKCARARLYQSTRKWQ
jgi:hypothetical protein